MDVMTLRALLTLDKSQYEQGLKQAESNASSFGSKFAGKMGKAAKVGAVALGAFAVSSVKVGADFDKSMSQVAATMGFTVEELNKDGSKAQQTYKQLEEKAREMGKSTKFSAQESAEALNYMALAGYKPKVAMEALPKVLDLAAAGNMDLARASDIVTDAQSALGLSMEQTYTMVDQMAKTSSKTNTSVEQLGEAFLTVGGTAKIMKGGTTELSAALGVLANAGIKGSEGGTALRNVLNSISGKKFEKNFKSMGVEAYDAQGKLRALPDILTDMNSAMEGMTDEEKTKLISNTFNVRDLKSVNALLAQTPGKWRELTSAIEDSDGAASNMAEVQLDNLSGDVTKLKSAFSELQIAVSDIGNGPLRILVQRTTDAITVLGELASAKNFAEFKDVLTTSFKEAEKGIDGYLDNLSGMLPKVAEAFTKMIPQVMNGLVSMSSKARGFASAFVDVGLSFVKSIAKGIIDNIPTFIETVPVIITNLAGFINDNAPKIMSAGISIIKYLGVGLVKAIPVLVKNIPKIIKATVSVFTAFGWSAVGKRAVNLIGRGLRSGASLLKSAVMKPVTATRAAIIAGFTGARDKVRKLMDSIKDSVKDKIESAKETVKNAVEKIKGFFPFNIGKIIDFKTPSISIKTSSKKVLGKSITYPTGFNVSWHKKAMENPYMFSNATLIGAGEAGDEILYGRKALMEDIEEATSNRGTTIINNFTINKADDPDEVANTVIRKMRIEMRTA